MEWDSIRSGSKDKQTELKADRRIFKIWMINHINQISFGDGEVKLSFLLLKKSVRVYSICLRVL